MKLVLSCRRVLVLPCLVLSFRVVYCLVLPCLDVPCLVLSSFLVSFLESIVFSSYFVRPCLVFSHFVPWSYLVPSCGFGLMQDFSESEWCEYDEKKDESVEVMELQVTLTLTLTPILTLTLTSPSPSPSPSPCP
jgi:hypothetical protein